MVPRRVPRNRSCSHNEKRIFTVLTFTTLSASILFGQTFSTSTNPPTPAQMVSNLVARLTALLTLTTAQQTQATTIFTNEQAAVSALATSMQTAQTALQTAIKSNDQSGIVTEATQIGALTTQQVEDSAKASAAFYAILTPDQQTKYNELHAVGIGGPGGLGGGPGGVVTHGPGMVGVGR
jgi:Spy/CpxP family protein refolding chaperone